MVATRAYANAIGEDLYIGAASGKMISVVAALRAAGRKATLVSLPFPGASEKSRKLPNVVTGQDRIPAVFLNVTRGPLQRKAQGLMTFAIFSATRVRRDDIVLFYNHAFEYLLALVVLRIRGVRTIHDIEDAPITSKFDFKNLLNLLSYAVMVALSSERKVTVSNELGKNLQLAEFMAVQGIALRLDCLDRDGAWLELLEGGPLRILYGGSLMRSTGLDLFCDMIEILKNLTWDDTSGVVFEITGIGNLDRLSSLAANCPNGMTINLHGTLNRDRYLALLSSCHVGLSLRIPDEEISSTTFPSKVLEMSSSGLAVLSSVVSDIDQIFSAQTAFLLHDFNCGSLAKAIYMMATDPCEVRRRALAGQELVLDRFNPTKVGEALAEFLEFGRSSTS